MSIYFSNLQNQRKINQWYPFYSSMQSDAAFANMFAAMFTLKLAKNRPWIKVVNRNVNADSCRKLRFFLCSTLVPCWSVHFSHFIPELSIYHINDYFDSGDPSSMQDTCHTSTQLKWPCSPWVLVAQRVERPPVIGRSWVRFLLGTQIFICSTLVSCRLVHSSHKIVELSKMMKMRVSMVRALW